jgi:DNA-binding NarL/FixJ family response regulator
VVRTEVRSNNSSQCKKAELGMVNTVLMCRRAADLERLHDVAVTAGLSVVGMSTTLDVGCSLVRSRDAALLVTEAAASDGPVQLAVQRLRGFGPSCNVAVLVVADNTSTEVLWRLLCAGANSLWWRRAQPSALSLNRAAHETLHGGTRLDAALAQRLIQCLEGPQDSQPSIDTPQTLLSTSPSGVARSLLLMLAHGMALEQVAASWGLTPLQVTQRLRQSIDQLQATQQLRIDLTSTY